MQEDILRTTDRLLRLGQDILAFSAAFSATPAQRNKEAVRVFLVRGRDRMARLSIVAQCFRGDTDRAAIIFLRMPPEQLTETDLFEILHEFGHASLESDEVEALRFAEPLLIGMSAVAFLVITSWHIVTCIASAIYCLYRLAYWFQNRREMEPEIIADAYAIKCQPDTAVALAGSESIRRHLRRIAADAGRPRVARAAARKRLGMLEANLQLHTQDRSLIATQPIVYDWFILGLNIILVTAPIWGTGQVGRLNSALAAATAIVTALMFFQVWRKRYVEAQFTQLLHRGPANGT